MASKEVQVSTSFDERAGAGLRWVGRTLVLALLLLGSACASDRGVSGGASVRPLHTFSIVARDPATGELGVAVQSHWFSVGAVVPWAEAGVGAVATQSFVNPAYGPDG